MSSSAQFAQLVSAFGKTQATALIEYVDARLQEDGAAVAVIVNAIVPPPGPATSYPSRSLNAEFVVSATRDATVSYTLETSTAATSSGANDEEAYAELRINGLAAHSARNRIVATLTSILGLLGISLTANVQRWVLSARVPAGSRVEIVTSGAGTTTLMSAQETLL